MTLGAGPGPVARVGLVRHAPREPWLVPCSVLDRFTVLRFQGHITKHLGTKVCRPFDVFAPRNYGQETLPDMVHVIAEYTRPRPPLTKETNMLHANDVDAPPLPTLKIVYAEEPPESLMT